MKIEDLTLKQIREMCKKHRHGRRCVNCPIEVPCDDACASVPCSWNDEDMKREVKPNE